VTPDQLIDYVSRNESGGDYSAWNPDDNGHGVSFGLIQFNQRAGSLPELLRRMYEADPKAFNACFGSAVADLLDSKWVRSHDLSGPDWDWRFKLAGAVPAFQQAQRDLAREGYLEPAWKACQAVGLTSERAVAMAFDAAVQHGLGWTRKALARADLRWEESMAKSAWSMTRDAIFAELADKGLGNDNGRRHKILRDPELSDAPWRMEGARPVLKRGATGPEVKRLQELLNKALALRVDGEFGPRTSEALSDFIARVSPDRQWYTIETTPEVWAALEKAAEVKP